MDCNTRYNYQLLKIILQTLGVIGVSYLLKVRRYGLERAAYDRTFLAWGLARIKAFPNPSCARDSPRTGY